MDMHFHGDDRPAALHRRDDLHRYLNTPEHIPETLTQKDYNALSESARAQYDRARILYLSGGIMFGTPAIYQAELLLTKSFAENIGRNSGHAGLMLSGESTLGKTTTAKALMKYVFSQYKRQFPDFDRHDRIPIMYIEVPSASTGKLLMRTFADFLGLPVRPAESMGDIRNRVVDCINQAGTQLIVVDELQNLEAQNLGNGDSVNLLKNLHNDLPSTFLYSGIDLPNSELLSGSRGKQLSGRFNLMELEPFKRTNPAGRKEWKALVSSFEKRLPLRDHEVGSLTEHAEYLFDRTNGSIGSLGRLITGAAIEIVATGNPTEAVTLQLLKKQVLDLAAEKEHAKTKRKPAKGRPTSALHGSLVPK